jgi:Fe-S-cluster-containing dehydrogenase component
MSAEPVRLPGFLPASDPAARAGYADHPARVGFFTDTSVCIGCKACEVACKEWNALAEDGLSLSGMSYVARRPFQARLSGSKASPTLSHRFLWSRVCAV